MANVPEPDIPLPALDRLAAATKGNVEDVLALLLPGPHIFWRDMLALTWNIRTFCGQEKIKQFLSHRLALSNPDDFKLREQHVILEKPSSNLVWISLMFGFVTDVGKALSIVRLVPTSSEEWKAHVVFKPREPHQLC
ncbi:hypothetical protein CPB84DRAFT_1853147 [Gymnopilus junonius]|uniref:Uncharacterized protein n=1 Tax=Gymnopilus junonius TaxID=109634 RepID=A0A9P5TGT2_GYMJU|nr:hypothetical protein CPB84DRAFT_1853147 [Gymnopilus junonius]